jgi:hypothetical protein
MRLSLRQSRVNLIVSPSLGFVSVDLAGSIALIALAHVEMHHHLDFDRVCMCACFYDEKNYEKDQSESMAVCLLLEQCA